MLPSYLKKNSFKIFHFRIKVPHELRDRIGKTEFCKSLHTRCELTARRKAIHLAEEAHRLFDNLRMSETVLAWSEQALPRHVRRAGEKTVAIKKKILLSELIELYVDAKLTDLAWFEKEAEGNKKIFQDVIKEFGDKPIDQYTRTDGQTFKKLLTQMPQRTSAKNKYKDLSLSQVTKIKPANAPVLSITTVNRYLGTVSSMFRWAVEFHHCKENPFQKLQFNKKAQRKAGVKPANQQRSMLTDDDIWIIFSALPMNEIRTRKVSYPLDFWGPLISAYSGARASEIAQLDVADIMCLHDVWCFAFVDAEEGSEDKYKKVKTENAERVVPIHSALISLGFLDYVKSVNETKLFPQEEPVAGKYGKRFSSDFATFRKDIYPEGVGVTLHGFRHSHATKLSRAGYSEKVISQLQGREQGKSITGLRYIKNDEIEYLSQAIESVVYKGEQYGDVLAHVLAWREVESKITFEVVNAKFKHEKKKGGISAPVKKVTRKTVDILKKQK